MEVTIEEIKAIFRLQRFYRKKCLDASGHLQKLSPLEWDQQKLEIKKEKKEKEKETN